MKNRPFRERMGFAIEGIRFGWARETSFRTQTALAGCALLARIVLRPAQVWWAVVVGVAMVVATAPRFLGELGL